MKPIPTVTVNPAIDASCSVENVFAEHKLRCGAVRHDPGGGGINVARAVKKLGGDCVALYCGGGPGGEILGALLDAEKVPHQAISVREWTRENLTVRETSTGQQYRFVMPGPRLSEAEWQSLLEGVRALEWAPAFVVASGSLPPGVPSDFYGRLAGVVQDGGARLILDTSGQALSEALKQGVFLIKPSLRELRELARDNLEHEPDQDRAAMDIIKAEHCEAVVVSLGAAGVLLASREGCERFRSPTVPVRSKVGAGDSMVAGIALALARNETLRDAVRFGVAAGAAAVMNAGTELCHREDAERLFRQAL